MLSCQEVQKRFDVFLDGEADGRTMRDLALHVTQCVSCESDLRLYERCHAAFVGFIEHEVDRIDVANLWQRIRPGLAAVPEPWTTRVVSRWRDRPALTWAAPTLAAAASFAAVVAIGSYRSSATEPATALASNEAHIEALDANAEHVAVWSEPIERTTAIWFASHEP
jgi:hypothetical protein